MLPPEPAPLVGLILCAGASSRLGYPKRDLRWGDETFLSRLARLFSAVASRTLIVQPPSVSLTLPGCHSVTNPRPERGMLSSLQCGLAAAPEAASVLFSPVDYAAVQAETIAALLAAAARTPHPIVKPVFTNQSGEHSGHPVLVRGDALAALRTAPEQAIARDLLKPFPALRLPVPDLAVGRDVDTMEEYLALCRDLQMPIFDPTLPAPSASPQEPKA